MQINPLGRNWGSLVNWDGLGMAILETPYRLNITLTEHRKAIHRTYHRLVGGPHRGHHPAHLAPEIAFRPDPQLEDCHHIHLLPAHLSGEDLARIHHKWPFPVQRRVLDYEHISAFRHRSLPG